MAKNLFSKYFWEVTTIFESGKITLRQLNEKWAECYLYDGKDIPRKTFDNHRKEIEMIFDLNIVCNKSDNTYSIEDADDFQNGKIRRWLLSNFAVNNMLNEAKQLKRRVLFEEIPSGHRFLLPVIQAMRENKLVKITHRSFARDYAKTVTIAPLALKISHQRWYITTQLDDAQMRVYALDRILSLEISDQKFEYPKDFSAEDYFADCYGIIAGAVQADVVRLKVKNNQQKFFRSLPLHPSQKEIETKDDYSIFEYYIQPAFDFQQTILSFGESVEVLAPEWLRTEITEKIKKMMEIYQQ
ncbi:MAG: WYL domain-containing protein [Bacteroidales bacterium]|nr:WYL domain-containing protein [Bacteroidales bacterium]